MHDEEIEKAVLYFVIINNEELDIEESDFIDSRNRIIAKAIIELREQKEEISILTIQNKIDRNKTQVIKYIAELGNNIYGTTVDNCYNKLKELSKKRKIFSLAQTMIKESQEIENVDTYIQDCIKELNNIENVNTKEKTFVEQVADTTTEIEKNYNNRNDYSLYTGILDLDKMTCGLHKQELTIIRSKTTELEKQLSHYKSENI